jgi:ribosomal protein S17
VLIKEIKPLAKTVTFEITEIIKEKQAVPKTKKEKK